MKKDFMIDNTLHVSLADLGRKGCVAYVFNAAAKARVDEFLDFARSPAFMQDDIEAAIKKKLSVDMWNQYQGETVPGARSILEIAAGYPKKYQQWRESVDRAAAGVFI